LLTLEAAQAAKEQSLRASEELDRALRRALFADSRCITIATLCSRFLPDGTDMHNPGIEMHWQGEAGTGFPVIDHDDPTVYDDLLKRAAG
jgi:hypothetical protein